ncbi:MAG: efflux RND transporter periplasmic adaptor subunit [Bacteroidota bacterium]
MNKAILLLTFAVLITACQTQEEPSALSLEEQKALLETKKETFRNLESEIADLEALIASNDPSFNQERSRLVTLEPVEKTGFKTFAEIQGAVRTDKNLKPSSQIGGRLIRLYVDEGDRVRKGQLLGITDTSQIVKGIEELQTSLTLARDVAARQGRLWEQKIGSELQLLQAENQVESLEKRLESLLDQKSKKRIYAPISGVVDRVLIEQGEMAGPGSPIVLLIDLRKLRIIADVSEKYVKAISRGDYVDVTIPAIDLKQKARVSMIGRTLNPGNRTFAVEVQIDNPKGYIKPNMLATMFILDYETDEAVLVSSTMVQQDVSGKDFVFIAKEKDGEMRAEKVFVETGISYLGKTEILSGLEGTEQVIVKGSREVSSGELLEVSTTSKRSSPVKENEEDNSLTKLN